MGGNFTKLEGQISYWSAYYDGNSFTRHTVMLGGTGVRMFEVFNGSLYNVGAIQYGSSLGVGEWTGSTWTIGLLLKYQIKI